MRIKVDEDLPNAVAPRLRSAGYEASSVRGQGMGGWKDHRLWPAVQAERKLLMTADKGFADIRVHPPGTHAGVVLLRPDEEGIRPFLELVEQLLASVDLTELEEAVAVVSPRGIRVRRPDPPS